MSLKEKNTEANNLLEQLIGLDEEVKRRTGLHIEDGTVTNNRTHQEEISR